MKNDIIIALSTCPDRKIAKEIAAQLVRDGLVKCAHLSKGKTESLYIWKGKFYDEFEYKLEFKIPKDKLTRARETFKKMHPYECPEWIEVCVSASKQYSEWINSERLLKKQDVFY